METNRGTRYHSNSEKRNGLNKIIKKSARRDREQANITILNDLIDERESWKNIRAQKAEYKPQANIIEDKTGRRYGIQDEPNHCRLFKIHALEK